MLEPTVLVAATCLAQAGTGPAAGNEWFLRLQPGASWTKNR